ncbi:hypothetical protein BJ912DRAFT_1056262 [Pholiota molesta]|nr:hypothetical protein BJ912DRAFT_1056262 [Pholiota molesta]
MPALQQGPPLHPPPSNSTAFAFSKSLDRAYQPVTISRRRSPAAATPTVPPRPRQLSSTSIATEQIRWRLEAVTETYRAENSGLETARGYVYGCKGYLAAHHPGSPCKDTEDPPSFGVRSCAVVHSSSVRRCPSFVFIFIFRFVVPCTRTRSSAVEVPVALPAQRGARRDRRAGEPVPLTPSVFINRTPGASACCRGYDDNRGGGAMSNAYRSDTDVPGLRVDGGGGQEALHDRLELLAARGKLRELHAEVLEFGLDEAAKGRSRGVVAEDAREPGAEELGRHSPIISQCRMPSSGDVLIGLDITHTQTLTTSSARSHLSAYPTASAWKSGPETGKRPGLDRTVTDQDRYFGRPIKTETATGLNWSEPVFHSRYLDFETIAVCTFRRSPKWPSTVITRLMACTLTTTTPKPRPPQAASPLLTPPLQQGCGFDHARRRNRGGGHQGQTQEAGEPRTTSMRLRPPPGLAGPLLSVPRLSRDDAHHVDGHPPRHPRVPPDDTHHVTPNPTNHPPPTPPPRPVARSPPLPPPCRQPIHVDAAGARCALSERHRLWQLPVRRHRRTTALVTDRLGHARRLLVRAAPPIRHCLCLRCDDITRLCQRRHDATMPREGALPPSALSTLILPTTSRRDDAAGGRATALCPFHPHSANDVTTRRRRGRARYRPLPSPPSSTSPYSTCPCTRLITCPSRRLSLQRDGKAHPAPGTARRLHAQRNCNIAVPATWRRCGAARKTGLDQSHIGLDWSEPNEVYQPIRGRNVHRGTYKAAAGSTPRDGAYMGAQGTSPLTTPGRVRTTHSTPHTTACLSTALLHPSTITYTNDDDLVSHRFPPFAGTAPMCTSRCPPRSIPDHRRRRANALQSASGDDGKLGHASVVSPRHPPPSTQRHSQLPNPSTQGPNARDTIRKAIAADNDIEDDDDDGASPLSHTVPSTLLDNDSSIAGASNGAHQPKIGWHGRHGTYEAGLQTACSTCTAARVVSRFLPPMDASTFPSASFVLDDGAPYGKASGELIRHEAQIRGADGRGGRRQDGRHHRLAGAILSSPPSSYVVALPIQSHLHSMLTRIDTLDDLSDEGECVLTRP